MEVAVIQHHRAGVALPYLKVIVEDQSQLGVPLEIALHLNNAVDRTVDDEPIRIEKHRELLKDVDENLILHVLLVCDLRHGPLNGRRGDRV